MFPSETTFIIGAGASCELGLPSGDRLKSNIISLLKSTHDHTYVFENKDFVQDFRLHLHKTSTDKFDEKQKYATAASKIREGLPWSPSIDNYLFTHQSDKHLVTLAKSAIARCILDAEKESLLFPSIYYGEQYHTAEPTLKNEKLIETWLAPFTQILFSQTKIEDLPDIFGQCSFIIFNYDRCLEHFLWLAIQSHFSIPANQAAEILSNAAFVHPYGSLGPLPWQAAPTETSVPMGGNRGGYFAFEVGSRLKTFTESTESSVADEVKRLMASADTLLFLGFGFLQQNLDLLLNKENLARKMFATAYGISEPDTSYLKRYLKVYLAKYIEDDAINVCNLACRGLFDEYRVSLSR